MSISRVTLLGQAVASEISSMGYPAEYEYIPQYTFNDIGDIKIIVTDAGGDISLDGRRTLTYTDTIRIVILAIAQSSGGGIDNDKVDTALAIMDAIIERLAILPIGESVFTWRPVSISRRGGDEKAHYYPENLEQKVFAAACDIVYVSNVKIGEIVSS